MMHSHHIGITETDNRQAIVKFCLQNPSQEKLVGGGLMRDDL